MISKMNGITSLSAASEFKVRPVLVAHSRQRRLWPLSTPATPFCMRGLDGRLPPLSRTLQALASVPGAAPPLVIMTAEAAHSYASEIVRIENRAQVLIVPSGIGSGLALVLAALIESARDNPLPIALIPGSFVASDLVSVFDAFFSGAAEVAAAGKASLLVSRGNAIESSIRLELDASRPGRTVQDIRCVLRKSDDGLAQVAGEAGTLATACGPAVIPHGLILKSIEANFSTIHAACRNALHLAERGTNTIKPHTAFIRLAGRPGLMDLLSWNRSDIRAVLTSTDARTVQSFRDRQFKMTDHVAAGHVGVAGYPGCRIIASEAGALVLEPGKEDTVKDIYDASMNWDAESRRAKPRRKSVWGESSVLMEADGAHICKKTIYPGMATPVEGARHGERSILVVAGAVNLLLPTSQLLLVSGAQTIVAADAAYAMTNDGDTAAIVLETSLAPPVETGAPVRLSA